MIDASEKSAEAIWTWPLTLDGAAPATVIVEGVRENGVFKPQRASLPEPAEPAVGRPLIPFRADLLPQARLRVFGVEERIAIVPSEQTTIACDAGNRAAGVAVAFTGRFPRQAGFDIVVEGRLEGAQISLIRSGGDVSRASDRIGVEENGVLSVPPGIVTQDAELVVVCPDRQARIELRSIRLVANIRAADTTNGTWIWNGDHWRDRPAALAGALHDAGIDEIYLQLPLDDRSHLDGWQDFLTHLQRAGIRIVAVEGDPEMVTPHGRRNALARAARLAAFRRDHPGLIVAVQYDVEPYLLQSHAVDPKGSWTAWGTLLKELHEALGTRVSAVVPFWMIDDAAAGRALATAADHVEDLVVMAYRTDRSEVERLSADWLEFAAPAGLGVRVALENGPLAVEYHRTYRRSERGDVALVDISGAPALAIYEEPVRADPTRATYAFSHEVASDPRRVTFDGDGIALQKVGSSVRETLAAWPNFRGLAFHELIGIKDSRSHGGCETRTR